MVKRFENEYEFLSNFFPSEIFDGSVIFPTVEHYFQAAKTVNMEDYLTVATAKTPGIAKRLGKQISLRPDWESVKDDVMLTALRQKFSSPELKEKLLSTGEEILIEGNSWHDNYWGSCDCAKCKNKNGTNKLGILLMQVREEIKKDA